MKEADWYPMNANFLLDSHLCISSVAQSCPTLKLHGCVTHPIYMLNKPICLTQMLVCLLYCSQRLT